MKALHLRKRVLKAESLENRELMAADISYDFSTKTLNITGDQYNDQVEIRYIGSEVRVDLYSQRSNGTIDHRDRTKQISDVRKIFFDGFAGNDKETVVAGLLSPGVSLSNTSLQFIGNSGDDQFVNNAPVVCYSFGGPGNDVIQGGSLADGIYGDEGNDILKGGDGRDRIYGGLGDDQIDGEGGGDSIFGEEGFDQLAGGTGDDGIDGGDGNDLIWGGYGDDWLTGDLGNDILQGEDGVDHIFGGIGNDTITGGNGDDYLYGDTGEDSIYGNAGNDYLDGGADSQVDYLVGGTGNDTFRSQVVHKINNNLEIILEEDWVADFTLSDFLKKLYV